MHGTPKYVDLFDQMFQNTAVDGTSFCIGSDMPGEKADPLDISSDEEHLLKGEDEARSPIGGTTPLSSSTPRTPFSSGPKRGSSTSTTLRSPSKRTKLSDASNLQVEANGIQARKVQVLHDMADMRRNEAAAEAANIERVVAEAAKIGVTAETNKRLYAAIRKIIKDRQLMHWFFASDAAGKMVVLEDAAGMEVYEEDGGNTGLAEKTAISWDDIWDYIIEDELSEDHAASCAAYLAAVEAENSV